MYKLHLILKYLRKRRIAWVSLLAVILCTAMVLVVISVMGGWLRMFRTSFHGLSGDIILRNDSLAGFPYYKEMIARIRQLPDVQAAVPTIQTFGLININARKTAGVQVIGCPPDIGEVNNFPESLWRQYNEWTEWAEGKPIMPGERKMLRDRYGIRVRPGEELLELTGPERQRLKDAQNSLQSTITQTRRNLGEYASGDLSRVKFPSEQERNNILDQRTYLDGLEAFSRRVSELVSGQGAPVTVLDRDMIRRRLGSIVEEPDKLLLPTPEERKLLREQGPKIKPSFNFNLPLEPGEYKEAFRRANPKASQRIIDETPAWHGMIAGSGVVNIHKDNQGKIVGREDFLYRIPVSLTVMGVRERGRFDLSSKSEANYWIVDTSRTKVWQYDSNTVYVDFATLQERLDMKEQSATDPDGRQTTIPARTSEIHVRVRRDVGQSPQRLIAVRDAIQQIADDILIQKAREGRPFEDAWPVARTWEQNQAKWLSAIEKEMVLVTGLFGLISVVAVFLIFCIFYMIVVEKTRDIGIIKSVGATSSGVASIFLGYGAAIGVVGSSLGLLVAWLIVRNINEIHAWLGRAMNIQVWDPEVYAFDTIPNTMDPARVTMIMVIAVLASIIGALVPALRAAKLSPVEALRWE